jgi:hypothetical protein
MAWRGMEARAYRTRSCVNAEMPAGMVPVNALFANILNTHPHDAHAEKRKHETYPYAHTLAPVSRHAHTVGLAHQCQTPTLDL